MKFLTSIRPSVIAKRATKKLGAAKNFIGGRSSFFNRGASSAGGSGLGGIAQGKVKPAPNGISNLISNISQTITGGDTNNININKLLGDKLSQFTDKISSGMQVPNLDGLMSSVSGISDFMKSFTDPTALNGITEGFQSVKSSLQETVDLATTVRKVLGKLIKQVNAAPSGGGGGGAGGLLSAGAGLVGAGIAGAAGVGAARKGLGFAKFLASKKSLAMIGLGAAGAGAALGAGNAAEAADISTQMRMTDVQPTGGMPADQIALFNSTVERFDKYLDDAKTKQRSTGGGKTSKGTKTQKPPGGPSGAPVDYSNLKSGDISNTAGKSAVLYDEFRNLGYTDEAAKRLVAEIGREGSFSNKNLFGTHFDPKTGVPNTGMFSWNDTRRTALIEDAKKAGVWDEQKGQLKETPEALRFQARFAKKEIDQRGAGLPQALSTPGYSGSKISELLRDKYIVYDASYAGGTDPNYGSVRSKEWYNKIAPGLEKTYTGKPVAKIAPTLNTNVSANTNLQPTQNVTLADAFDPTSSANTGGGGINFINLGSATAPRPKPQPKPAQPGNTVAPISACSGYNPVTAAAAAIYGISCAAR